MYIAKIITRISIWSIVVLLIGIACFFYFFGDINKIKNKIEENLKNQLTCVVKLGELNWDWDGLKLGVTTSAISLYDKGNNLVLQGGPTRFVWHIKNIITGSYSHFFSIESTNLYVNVIRYRSGEWNLIKIFPPGPPPKVDNLEIHNGIVYLIDELNPSAKTILYKDCNLNFKRKLFSVMRQIDLTTRIGSLTSSSLLKLKGRYSESQKFNWDKSVFNLYVVAKQINLSNWYGYLTDAIKEPNISKIRGEFSGIVRLKKDKHNKLITIRSKTNTKDFIFEFTNKEEIKQLIEIPKTDFILKTVIEPHKISLKTFKSHIGELTYELSGYIYNWDKNLPEVELKIKTNKFNFKNVKPYLPIALLPVTTRTRIEPINDDGFVELDLALRGSLIAPQYKGTILLEDFNLTTESGFLSTIHGLDGMLTLDDQNLQIDYLNIPIEDSRLSLKGLIDNKNNKTSFSLNGSKLSISILKDLLAQAVFPSPLLSQAQAFGKLDLNLNVESSNNSPPDIKGQLQFHDAGVSVNQEEPLDIKNLYGELILDGAKVVFDKFSGLINDEAFSIQGDLSLKEDEKINLSVQAKQLKIIPNILSFITAQTPFKPIAKTISGEASNLNLSIGGTFIEPLLNGIVSINNVSFKLPNLEDSFSNISGDLKFNGTEFVIEDLRGMIQNSEFAIAGYIDNLFKKPTPKFRLVTTDIDLTNIWSYTKEQLKNTSFNIQSNAIETLKGVAALDVFIQSNAILGNIYFKDAEIKHKSIPFILDNLSGRLVIGDKNISVFGLMGSINGANTFISDVTISNYLDPKFNVQGQLQLDLDLPAVLKAANANSLNTITVVGLIPTIINFDFSPPLANLRFHSILDEMLQLDLEPYIKKPLDKSYTATGNFDFDINDFNLYINDLSINATMLSLTANGNIKNITSENPDLMIYFTSNEPCGIFMIIEPIAPLMGYKIWGLIELNGSINGTPSMYLVTSNARIKDMRIQSLLGKKLKSTDGEISAYIDNSQSTLNLKINNIDYASLKAKSILLSANYIDPVFYLNEFSLDGDPKGSIYALGSYDEKSSAVSFSANGSGIDLSSLGAFVFLAPEKLAGETDFSIMIDGQGKTKDEILSSANGNLSFAVTDGKLGQVALLQKGLQIANILSEGIFGFSLNNVFSLFFKYQDGSFNKIKGDLDLNKGVVKVKEFIYRAKDLFLNSFGFIDLSNSFVGVSFYGYLPEQPIIPKHEGATPTSLKETISNTVTGAISIIPDTFGKK